MIIFFDEEDPAWLADLLSKEQRQDKLTLVNSLVQRRQEFIGFANVDCRKNRSLQLLNVWWSTWRSSNRLLNVGRTYKNRSLNRSLLKDEWSITGAPSPIITPKYHSSNKNYDINKITPKRFLQNNFSNTDDTTLNDHYKINTILTLEAI